MPAQSLTANNNQISQPISINANSRVTAVNGYVQYTTGSLQDARNNAVTWSTWPVGALAGTATAKAAMTLRLVATADSATLVTDEPIGPQPTDIFPNSYWLLDNGRQFNSSGVCIAGGMYVLAKSAVPYGIANTSVAGIQANGTFTLGTALNTIYTGGIWLYFPANAVSGDAVGGWYWCVMTSTTAGTAYTSSAATTAVTGSGAGYTGDTSARTAVTVTVPANAMGKNGSFRLLAGCSNNNSVGNKTIAGLFGGTTFASLTGASTAGGPGLFSVINNRNSNSLQACQSCLHSTTIGPLSYLTKDTTSNHDITITLQIATATDVLVLENYIVEMLPA